MRLFVAFVFGALAFGQQSGPHANEYRTWSTYGGDPGGTHYSSLKQINKKNVAQLKVAWTYESHDEFPGSEIECSPIVVDGVLYATTPKLRVVALDAATGVEKWSFDPNEGHKAFSKMRNRGLTYWDDGAGKSKRLFI